METTGKRLKLLRKESGLKLEDYAKGLGLGIQLSSFSEFENNKRTPTTETLLAIAAKHGVSVDWLLCRSDVRNPDARLAELNFPADVLEVARKLADMENGRRRLLLDYIQELDEGFELAQERQVAYLRSLLERRGGLAEWEAKKKIKLTE